MRLIIFVLLIVYTRCDDYPTRRKRILELEAKRSVGGNITLTDKEARVNECLMRHKTHEVDYGFNHTDEYKFSHHFFTYKDKIPDSKVHKIIKAMPKGAVLHIHDMAILGPDYLLNVTYMDNLYVCFAKRIKFLFSNKVPNTSCDDSWQLLSEVRRVTANVTKLDLEIKKHFSLVVPNPDVAYPSITESWKIFMQFFGTVVPLLTYRPMWEQYFYDALKAFREDYVMYVEVRSVLPQLYELDGTVYDQEVTAKAYRKTIKRFMKDYPDFIGAKLIYAPARLVSKETVTDYIKVARDLSKTVPEIFAGFDLVGQEDVGNPLINFASTLDTVKDLNFFFHAGETDWYGTSSDENLIDAVLLGAKRIGHAYALTKHPEVMQLVIEKNICLEVNVVSNAVLSLVRDVRNHPLSVFLSLGLPVVLSSDDPGAWEADLLSDDFYVAFVGVASKHADLTMLKALALNSLKCSALDTVNKENAIRDFNIKWSHFVDTFDCSLY